MALVLFSCAGSVALSRRVRSVEGRRGGRSRKCGDGSTPSLLGDSCGLHRRVRGNAKPFDNLLGLQAFRVDPHRPPTTRLRSLGRTLSCHPALRRNPVDESVAAVAQAARYEGTVGYEAPVIGHFSPKGPVIGTPIRPFHPPLQEHPGLQRSRPESHLQNTPSQPG